MGRVFGEGCHLVYGESLSVAPTTVVATVKTIGGIEYSNEAVNTAVLGAGVKTQRPGLKWSVSALSLTGFHDDDEAGEAALLASVKSGAAGIGHWGITNPENVLLVSFAGFCTRYKWGEFDADTPDDVNFEADIQPTGDVEFE